MYRHTKRIRFIVVTSTKINWSKCLTRYYEKKKRVALDYNENCIWPLCSIAQERKHVSDM